MHRLTEPLVGAAVPALTQLRLITGVPRSNAYYHLRRLGGEADRLIDRPRRAPRPPPRSEYGLLLLLLETLLIGLLDLDLERDRLRVQERRAPPLAVGRPRLLLLLLPRLRSLRGDLLLLRL